jgi:hypothetical protein
LSASRLGIVAAIVFNDIQTFFLHRELAATLRHDRFGCFGDRVTDSRHSL